MKLIENNIQKIVALCQKYKVGKLFVFGSILTNRFNENTEDPECVVLRFENKDIMSVYEALLECFNGIEIEVDEDVEDLPWSF